MIRLSAIAAVLLTSACVATPPQERYVGTTEPFAADAIYFVVTDRFVDGDPANNYPQQGAPGLATFDRPIENLAGQTANIGYLGGDFRGLLDNADYISDMGFGAVWITPVVANPDEAFSGGYRLGEAHFADRGKTGYHGYWGVNFFVEDEHLVSPGLTFRDLTGALRDQHGLKTVLDIVCNHGSPGFTMPADQPLFGEIYDHDGTLIADHRNRPPAELEHSDPLQAFFHTEPDIAELGNINERNPAVLDYFVRAYLHWIDAGAAAFRIDTIRHMPHAYWKAFSDEIRRRHPGFFMFGESFNYDAATIAEHTYPDNGAISVLDFPGQKSITSVFGSTDSDFSALLDYLHLTDGLYENPYDLMTFYDNHDMPRMSATTNGFIDANNWLFTARGIPVVYYGSETGFRAGRPEHGGNRDFYGQPRIDAANRSPIYPALRRIARLRKSLPALQRGLQVNIEFSGNTAAFLRVLQTQLRTQTVLVALNKGDSAASIVVNRYLSHGAWRDAETGEVTSLDQGQQEMTLQVPAHGVRLLVHDSVNTDRALLRELGRLQKGVTAAAQQRTR